MELTVLFEQLSPYNKMEQIDQFTSLPVCPEVRSQALQGLMAHKDCHLTQHNLPLWETKLELKYEKLLFKLQDVYIAINQFVEISKNYKSVTQQQRQELLEQKNTLLLRQSQIFMVLFLIENKGVPGFEDAYKKSFASLNKFKISAQRLKERPLNFFILSDLFEMEIKYNHQYLRTIRALHSAAEKSEKDFRNAMKKTKVMISKITTMVYGFSSACLFPLDDLFSQPKSSERWEKLKSVMKIEILANKERLQESFDSVRGKLVFTCAALNKYKTMKEKVGLLSVARGLYNIAQYAMSSEKAKWRAELCIANPDGRFMKEMWNLPQKSYFRPFVDIIMPRIKYSQDIYVKRVVSSITLERVHNWEEDNHYGLSDEYEDEFGLMPQHNDSMNAELFKAPPTDDISNMRIKIKVNSPIPLKFINQQQSFFSRLFGSENKKIETIIFHIHGGGFISMSPYIHQAYVRKWANNLGVPIFSIDYRKSPEYAFPDGLDDCFQTYVWMIKYLEKIFDLNLKKIVIVGDSAGANLGMALVNLAIRFQIRVPDSLFLIYPALNLEDNKYTPSIMAALEDLVLPHTFLKICQKSYIQDQTLKPQVDPFISPIHTSDEFLKAYPSVRIYVGNMDPFHDDCCRLTQRFLNLKKDVQLVVFDSFPHGFLQFDIPPEGNEFSEIAIKEIENELKYIIQR